jgi:hypothetical protein
MATMDIATMKGRFREGLLQSAIISPLNPEADSWCFFAVDMEGQIAAMAIARTTTQKLYSSVDAAVGDAFRIGFKTVTVQAQQGAAA